jgi:hypothetical protein
MLRWFGLLVALPLCGGCVASIPTDALRDTQFAVESLTSVYLLDGTGERATRVLERRLTRDGPGFMDKLHDEYFAPSLSPDRSRIACLRFRNNSGGGNIDELMPLQSVEVLLVRLADRSEQVVNSIPATGSGRVYRVLAPVWSEDGGRIFFAADQRVWAYALGAVGPEAVVDIPEAFNGGFRTGNYLRPSRDGGRLFGLLERRNRFTSYHVIVSIDIVGGRLTPLWTGRLRRQIEIDRPVTTEVLDDVVEALFGSREHPVFEPRASRDGRFYFFDRHEMGLFGREWVAGYDRVTRREFEVRTMWRTLFWN